MREELAMRIGLTESRVQVRKKTTKKLAVAKPGKQFE